MQDQLLRERSSLEQRELQRQLEIAIIAKERKVRVQSGGAFTGHGNSTESGPHVAESSVSPPHLHLTVIFGRPGRRERPKS